MRVNHGFASVCLSARVLNGNTKTRHTNHREMAPFGLAARLLLWEDRLPSHWSLQAAEDTATWLLWQ